jgi:hypothetical protein
MGMEFRLGLCASAGGCAETVTKVKLIRYSQIDYICYRPDNSGCCMGQNRKLKISEEYKRAVVRRAAIGKMPGQKWSDQR